MLKSKFNLTHHENETIVCELVGVQRCHLPLLSFVEWLPRLVFASPSTLQKGISGTPRQPEEGSFVFWELIPLNHFLFPLGRAVLIALLCVLFCSVLFQ